MNNELNDYVKKKNYIGYIISGSAIIIAALWALILIVRGEIRNDNKAHDKEIADLHLYYQKRDDKKDSIYKQELYIARNTYQLAMDKQREADAATIAKLEDRIDVIDNNSQVNGKLARSNDTKSKRNVKILNEAHRQIKR